MRCAHETGHVNNLVTRKSPREIKEYLAKTSSEMKEVLTMPNLVYIGLCYPPHALVCNYPSTIIASTLTNIQLHLLNNINPRPRLKMIHLTVLWNFQLKLPDNKPSLQDICGESALADSISCEPSGYALNYNTQYQEVLTSALCVPQWAFGPQGLAHLELFAYGEFYHFDETQIPDWPDIDKRRYNSVLLRRRGPQNFALGNPWPSIGITSYEFIQDAERDLQGIEGKTIRQLCNISPYFFTEWNTPK